MASTLKVVFTALTAILLLPGQSADLARYRVTWRMLGPNPGGSGQTIIMSVRDKESNAEKSFTLSNSTVDIRKILSPELGKLVTFGDLDGGGTVINILDLATGTVVDTVWAWETAVSPSERFVAYAYRCPPYGLPQFRNSVLLLYDFLRPPNAIPHVDGEDDRKGFILYPDENRLTNSYQIASPGKCCDGGRTTLVLRVFTSPIVWNARSDRIAVVENVGGENHLVLVDIAGGPDSPRTKRIRLNERHFLKDQFSGEMPPPGHSDYKLLISSISLESDRVAVVNSAEVGPYAAKSVAVNLLSGEQSVRPTVNTGSS